VVLYMTEALLPPGRVEHVAGFAGLRAAIEAMIAPLSSQGLALMIYGLYSGLICFTPLFGGLLADRVHGPAAIIGQGCYGNSTALTQSPRSWASIASLISSRR
jgi:POT family proton-dependent oligopeptide transporter